MSIRETSLNIPSKDKRELIKIHPTMDNWSDEKVSEWASQIPSAAASASDAVYEWNEWLTNLFILFQNYLK